MSLHLRRTPRETAILIALMLKRSGRTRMRLSLGTLKLLSGRERIHLLSPFLPALKFELGDLDVIFVEASHAGYVCIKRSALDGATSIKVPDDLLAAINDPKTGMEKYAELRDELYEHLRATDFSGGDCEAEEDEIR